MNGELTINGRRQSIEFDGADTLLMLLRTAGYTEVKQGCAHGECGSCLVLLDGKPVNSCQIYAATVEGREITTSLGLTGDGSPHEIHEAFADSGGVQCGFCTPGMVVASYALLDSNPDPSDAEIAAALSGNICRCTGYVKTIDAVRDAAKRLEKKHDRGGA